MHVICVGLRSVGLGSVDLSCVDLSSVGLGSVDLSCAVWYTDVSRTIERRGAFLVPHFTLYTNITV